MNKPPGWSLKQEIKKRRTQEIIREMEARMGQTPHPVTSFHPTPPVPAKPNPHLVTNHVAPDVSTSKPTPWTISITRLFPDWTKRQKQIAIVAAMMLVAVCLVTTVAATNQPFSQAHFAALPVASSDDFIGYLRRAKLPIANLRTFTVPNAIWNAQTEIQFEVYRGTDKGIFVILSYGSPARAGRDAFSATYDHKFNKWTLTQISNVLVLASPDTSAPLSAEIASHLTQYLVAPYRPFIPTATQPVYAR